MSIQTKPTHSVSDIVSIDQIDESDLVDDVQKGQENAEEIVEKLYALEKKQVKAMESVKEDLNDMRNYITDLETLFKDGDLTVGNYSVKAVSGLESFRSIYESVFGEGSIIDESLQVIFEKMLSGDNLTEVEREELYNYIQNVILGEDNKKDMQDLLEMIGEDSDRLINRLNEKVLTTENSLDREILLVAAHIYTGNAGPRKNELAVEDIGKLKGYLAILNNYKKAIDELKEEVDWTIVGGPNEPLLAQVTKLEHWKESGNYSMNFDTDIAISTYRGNDLTREEFLDSENLLLIRENPSKIKYYMGEDAAGNLQGDILKELEEKDATFIQDSIKQKLVEALISTLGKRGEAFNSAVSLMEIHEENQQNKRNMKIGEAHEAAMFLELEIEIRERHVPYEGTDYSVEVFPTDLTYSILDNWIKEYEKYPDLPIPLEGIEQHDWYLIAEKVAEYEDEIRTNFGDEVYRNIFSGYK